jgi:hypothetical protein
MRVLTPLAGSTLVAALVVDHVAFLGALIYLYALGLKLLPDRDAAVRSLWLLALFPTSFFFSAYYTESLFLFLTAAAFFHLHQRQWGRAVLFAALASACRVPGVFLYGVLMLEWLKGTGWRLRGVFDVRSWHDLAGAARCGWRTLLLIQLSVSGLAAYMAYLWVTFGDPLVFQHAQLHWGRTWQGPWKTIADGLTTLCRHDFLRGVHTGVHTGGQPLDFVADFNLFCLLAGLVLCVTVWRSFGASYACYCLVSLLVPASSHLLSLGRMTIVLFPLFMALAIHLHRPAVERATMTTFAALLAVFTALFAIAYFIV